MSRPLSCRRIGDMPPAAGFNPEGGNCSCDEEIVLALDEFEAVRLADYEGMYQEKAAELMGVSRPTFGRVLESAHHKISDAIVKGKRLRIDVAGKTIPKPLRMKCKRCENEWNIEDFSANNGHCPCCHRRKHNDKVENNFNKKCALREQQRKDGHCRKSKCVAKKGDSE